MCCKVLGSTHLPKSDQAFFFFFGKGSLLRLKTFHHPFIYACSLCTDFNSLSLSFSLCNEAAPLSFEIFTLSLSLSGLLLSFTTLLLSFYYIFFLSLSPKSFHKPSHPFAPPTICQDIVRHRSLSVCVWLSKYVYSWVEVGDIGFAGWWWEGEVPFL